MLDLHDIAKPLDGQSDLLDCTRRADIVNWFSGHPDIAPHIGGPLDFTPAMRDTTVFMFGEHGGLIFEWCAPGVYEAHIMLTRAGRGRWGIAATKEAVRKLGADLVWARVDPGHKALARHAALSGFARLYRKTLYVDGCPRVYDIYEWRK